MGHSRGSRCLVAAVLQWYLVLATVLPLLQVLSGVSAQPTPGVVDVATETADDLGLCRLERSFAQATFRFGGLLELHDSYRVPSRSCVRFGGWATVQQSAAYSFLIENAVPYLLRDVDDKIRNFVLSASTPPVVNGLAFDTCGSAQLAIQEAQILATDSEVYRNSTLGNFVRSAPLLQQTCASLTDAFNTSTPLLGIIGPMSTNGVTAVSPFFSTYSIPQVTYWASSTLFDDVEDYSLLFRTVPSDEFQAAAIADLIEHFGWTYVSLVAAEDDDYSGRGFELIQAEASARGTFCFAVASRFSGRPQFSGQTGKVVESIKASSAQVVILYAPILSANVFLDICQQREVAGKIFVGSHDWINRVEFLSGTFQSHTPIIGLAPRTVASSSTLQAVEDLKAALRNASYLQEAVRSDPWLGAYLEEQLNCSINAGSCSVSAPGNFSAVRPCELSDFQRFEPRGSMAIAESLTLGILSTGVAAINVISEALIKGMSSPSMNAILAAIEDVSMQCKNFTSRCRVYDSLHRAAATYYIQNVQFSAAGYRDVIPIGHWQSGEGFLWDANKELQLGSFGTFSPSLTNLSVFPTDRPNFPTSNCSHTCTPGQRRSFNSTLPIECCWTCVACEDATFSNTTNADSCTACPLGYGSNGVECNPYPPTQHQPSGAANITVMCVAGVSFILTLLSLVYFHYHAKNPIVRASDLTLSTITMVAMLIGHALVPVILIPGTITTTYCTVSAVLPEPVKAVVVSAVLVKTKRFNRVFKTMKIMRTDKKERVLLGHPMQVLTIVLLTAIDVILVLLYALIDPPQALSEPTATEVFLYCDLDKLWASLVSVYNVLLLCTCVVLAFLTRNLPERYNEAQLLYIASTTGFLVWLGLFPALILTGRSLRPLISALFLEVQILAFWLCLYVPRMIQMMLGAGSSKKESTNKASVVSIKRLDVTSSSSGLL